MIGFADEKLTNHVSAGSAEINTVGLNAEREILDQACPPPEGRRYLIHPNPTTGDVGRYQHGFRVDVPTYPGVSGSPLLVSFSGVTAVAGILGFGPDDTEPYAGYASINSPELKKAIEEAGSKRSFAEFGFPALTDSKKK